MKRRYGRTTRTTVNDYRRELDAISAYYLNAAAFLSEAAMHRDMQAVYDRCHPPSLWERVGKRLVNLGYGVVELGEAVSRLGQRPAGSNFYGVGMHPAQYTVVDVQAQTPADPRSGHGTDVQPKKGGRAGAFPTATQVWQRVGNLRAGRDESLFDFDPPSGTQDPHPTDEKGEDDEQRHRTRD